MFCGIYFATSLVQHSLESRDEIDKITPRISRLLGLIDSEQKMQESLLIVSNGSKSLTYPSTEEESVISATLQTELRRIMTEAGLTVSNSQVQKIRREGKFDHIDNILFIFIAINWPNIAMYRSIVKVLLSKLRFSFVLKRVEKSID